MVLDAVWAFMMTEPDRNKVRRTATGERREKRVALRMASDLRCSIVNGWARVMAVHEARRLGAQRECSAGTLQASDCALELARRDAVCADIRTQHFGNQDTAVGLLVVLDNRNPGASDG